MDNEYEAEVFRWGSAKPFEPGARVSNEDSFTWTDVKTNGLGDVLDMPLLNGKPCFARVEYFFRHGRKKNPPMKIRGQVRETPTRCGRCPIYDACRRLCLERVKSDSEMTRTLKSWRADSMARHKGQLVYTGESGWLWTAFKKAVVARGPFFNVNDERVREKERRAAETKLMKLRVARRRQREAQRKRQVKNRLPPSPEFLANAKAERDLRREALAKRAGDPAMPACISKILPKDAAKTSSITASAWLEHAILEASGREPRPGTIARRMVEQGSSEGLSYPTLKARISKDLDRAVELEILGVWTPFDPDSDIDRLSLADLAPSTEQASDASES